MVNSHDFLGIFISGFSGTEHKNIFTIIDYMLFLLQEVLFCEDHEVGSFIQWRYLYSIKYCLLEVNYGKGNISINISKPKTGKE